MDAFESEGPVVNHLRAAGIVDAAGMERAQTLQKTRGGSLVDALLRLNIIAELHFLRTFAELYSTRYVKSEKVATFRLDEELMNRVNVRAAERLRICPIRWDPASQELLVVAAPPMSATLEIEMRDLAHANSVVCILATPGAVHALIRAGYYGDRDAFKELTPNGAGTPFPNDKEALEDPAEENHREPTVLTSSPEEHDRSRTAPRPLARPEDATIAALRKEIARYRIAEEFHRRVALESNLSAMVERILAVIFDLLPAEGCAMWLHTGQTAGRSREGTQKVEVPRAIIDQVLKSATGVVINNALTDERFDRSASVMVRGIQSVMAVPLRTPRSGTVGILYAESHSVDSAFGQSDLPLLESIGAQAAILLDNAALLVQMRREVENRMSLQRFLSPGAAEEVLGGRLKLRMEGQRAEITVLFIDIRGFTTMSSQMQPEEVVGFLNTFFAEMVECVERHGGIVDKFIGDCVMALWGAIDQRQDNPRRAVACALEMVLRASAIKADGRPLEVGVGINTGTAVVGAIGSKRRLDYTAIGSTVNLSARLCGLADPGQVIITEDTLRQAGPGIVTEAGEPVILKGIDHAVVPYVVKRVVMSQRISRPGAT
ncbi:MAG TPA: adenylate/guanylate cyclase domain-containing protein [Myxococcales bacterium]|jgi:adenylate cyclase